MSEKAQITYIQKEKEGLMKVTWFNKRKLLSTFFVDPYTQNNCFNYYEIKNDIEYIHFQNVTFYQDVKFKCPKDTILILENCTFKGNRITFLGGMVQLINPKLSPDYYSNFIFGNDMEDFIATIHDQNSNYLRMSIQSKKIWLDGEERIKHLNLEGKEITVQNISKLKSLTLKGNTVKISNSDIYLESEEAKTIVSLTPIISPLEEDLSIYKIKNTNINQILSPIIEGEVLYLQNSNITSYDSLYLNCSKIFLEGDSFLQSYHDMILFQDKYINKASPKLPLILNHEILEKNFLESTPRKHWISVLKGIQKQTYQEIKEIGQKKMLESLTQWPKEEKISQTEKMKKVTAKTIKYETNTEKHKPIGKYKSLKKHS